MQKKILTRVWPVFVILAGLPVTEDIRAEDWAQWRGADRVAVWDETGIVETLPSVLKLSWRTPIRSGFSGPAVADGRVFITDWQEDPDSRTMDGTERVLALDEETGEVLWTHEWTTTYRMLMVSYAVGPRATPTVDDDRVYVVGATGVLTCLEGATGRVVWSKRFMEDYDTSVPTWGIASAPLVDGDRLIAVVGGEPDALVVAFDKYTGAEIWRAVEVEGEMGYGQPVILRGRWRPAADCLARRRPRLTQSRDRRRQLDRAVGS